MKSIKSIKKRRQKSLDKLIEKWANNRVYNPALLNYVYSFMTELQFKLRIYHGVIF
jgi:hypothetical protein